MRFRFCGNLDCPDWVLAQIQNLSKLTSVKLKLMVTQIVKDIISNEPKLDKLYELTSAAKFDGEDLRAVTAAVCFILTSAAKYDTSISSLSSELQQLGLPKEHATSLSKVYSDKHEDLGACLCAQSFRLNRLKDASYKVESGLSAKGLKNCDLTFVKLQMNVIENSTVEKVVYVHLTSQMLNNLIEDLETVEETMGRMNK